MPPTPRTRKRAYRKSKRFAAININESLALSTLAQQDLIATPVSFLTQEHWAISCDLTWTLGGLAAGEGPIYAGLAGPGLTAALIEEAVEANPVDEDDIVANERSKRPVRMIGSFPGLTGNEALNDGKAMRTKLRMIGSDDSNVQFWGYNFEAAAPLTTGAVLRIQGKLYITWR